MRAGLSRRIPRRSKSRVKAFRGSGRHAAGIGGFIDLREGLSVLPSDGGSDGVPGVTKNGVSSPPHATARGGAWDADDRRLDSPAEPVKGTSRLKKPGPSTNSLVEQFENL